MLEVIRLIVGQLRSNCYLLVNTKNKSCVVIDAGDDANYIASVIEQKRLRPEKIVATHGHFDHLLAAFEIQLLFNIPFLINKDDKFLLHRAYSSALHFTRTKTIPPLKANSYLKNEKFIKLAKVNFKILKTPGHTPGSITLYSKKEAVAFVGDVVFSQGEVGRYDFNYSDKSKLKDSVKTILALPNQTKVYPGHGEPTNIGKLKKFVNLL